MKNEQADLVFIAREFLRDSAWVLLAAQVLGVDVQWPNQYERSKRTLRGVNEAAESYKKNQEKSIP